MSKSLTELAADIVAAWASHSKMSVEDISDALRKAYNTLVNMKALEESPEKALAMEEPRAEQVPDKLAELQRHPMRSIRKNLVICLECGSEFKMLTLTHLKGHDLTPKQYRKKWGFSARQALSSQVLSEKRRQTAEELGLAEKLAIARAKRQPKKQPAFGPAPSFKKSPQEKKAAPAKEAKEFQARTILRKKSSQAGTDETLS